MILLNISNIPTKAEEGIIADQTNKLVDAVNNITS